MNLISKKTFLRIGLFYAYGLFGAWIFTLIEKREEPGYKIRERMLQELKTGLLLKYNMSDGDFDSFVQKVTEAAAAGDKMDWSFFNSCGFTFAALTTIGYGNIAPKTALGQGLTILFCLIGIPITMLAFKTAGELIAAGIKRAVVITETRFLEREEPVDLKMKTLLSTVFCLVMLWMLTSVSTIFLEKWSFVEGLYAWFQFFTTIGFGDYIQFQSSAKKVASGEMSTLSLLGYGILFMVPYLCGLSLVSGILTCIVDSMDHIREFHEGIVKRFTSWIPKSKVQRRASSYDVTC